MYDRTGIQLKEMERQVHYESRSSIKIILNSYSIFILEPLPTKIHVYTYTLFSYKHLLSFKRQTIDTYHIVCPISTLVAALKYYGIFRLFMTFTFIKITFE